MKKSYILVGKWCYYGTFLDARSESISYIFFKKKHIHSPVYSQPKAYSEHRQIVTMDRFAKITTSTLFKTELEKINKSTSKNISYISENGTFHL